MRKFIVLLPVVLVGCASALPPQQKGQVLVMDKQIHAMSRNEVINAVTECEGNNLRASMVYAKRQVNGFAVDVVIDVVCAPKYRY